MDHHAESPQTIKRVKSDEPNNPPELFNMEKFRQINAIMMLIVIGSRYM